MGWSYAHLSHLAKIAGGPEKYIASIQRVAEIKGLIKGIAIAVPGTLLFVVGRRRVDILVKSSENGRQKLRTVPDSESLERESPDRESDDATDQSCS